MDEVAPPLFDPASPPHGHEAFTSALRDALDGGRAAHGWLLSGPQGIGKAAMACMAAAWLLRERGDEPALIGGGAVTVDPADPGSNLVCKGHHPDLLVIRPELKDNKSGQIKLEQIRKLVGFMGHRPGRGGWRVAIIDSMDQVNRNGANALLKLLEEPPEKTMLFLVASRPGRLPPTIRSRCRLVRIAPPDEALCRDVIAGHLSDIDASRAEDLARLAEGAPGRALSLAQSQSDDFYRATCALLAEPRFDMAAAATLCEKWGRGGAEGQPLRDGAIWLIGRLLRLAAVRAAGKENVASVVCAFEEEAISRLVSHHGAGRLADQHATFLRSAGQMDGLYLDFGHFLSRELAALGGKSLP
tara:strand:+ start:5211 stop:6284 length:1074 start_codon:yes stop_codon:yes gene_type:complete